MLQGSLDNFALDEVLGLLASTTKSGTLDVKGDRGTGTLGLRQGQLVGASASNTANGEGLEDVLFELLRFGQGSFTFTPGDVAGSEGPRAVADVLSAAEDRLADWRTIETMVPSLNHTVSPVPALPADEITITRREWSTLIVIGSGCPVASVCADLGLGEVEGSRQVKVLAERGLVSVGPPLGKNAGPAGYLPRTAPAEPVSRPPAADPFARKAEQASRRVEALTVAAPPPPERPEPATTGRSSRGSLFPPAPVAGRPPMPAPPTAADLRQAARTSALDSLVEGAVPVPGFETAGNGNGTGTGNRNGNGNGNGHDTGNGSGKGTTVAPTVDDAPAGVFAPQPEPTKPGGLLMRYLKGED